MGGRRAKREEDLSHLLRALADPSRRKVIDLLRQVDEMRVGDVASAFDMSLYGVSKHLKVLEKAGLVHRRHEGTTHFISIRWDGLRPLLLWLDSQRHHWESRLDDFEDFVTRANPS